MNPKDANYVKIIRCVRRTRVNEEKKTRGDGKGLSYYISAGWFLMDGSDLNKARINFVAVGLVFMW